MFWGRRCECVVNDVAISLRGSYQTFFRRLNPENLQGCIDDGTIDDFRPGEVTGNDGPTNSCPTTGGKQLVASSA